jgi:hypothetical protein
MPVIDRLYAFIVTEAPGNEGIPATGPIRVKELAEVPMYMPLIAADIQRVESIRAEAQKIVDRTRTPMDLYMFFNREKLDRIEPRDPPESKPDQPEPPPAAEEPPAPEDPARKEAFDTARALREEIRGYMVDLAKTVNLATQGVVVAAIMPNAFMQQGSGQLLLVASEKMKKLAAVFDEHGEKLMKLGLRAAMEEGDNAKH